MGSPVKIKENVLSRGPLGTRWVAAGAAASLLALCGVALVDLALPPPLHRGAPPDRFIADIAYEHLVNLTSIGPRVAGSYANEVLAVGVLLAAVRDIARGAAPHHAVDIDLHTASGAFSIDFFDGLNNVYRSVQSVVVRVRGAGAGAGAARGSRTALLLNCHFDTVPDSPGASDDGAGCAVLLETLRALVASPAALRHDALFLLNGAEENIMQASHAFITQHKWAKTVRAFINIEACGSGGREVLFQAGPHDPWIMEVYAGAVPHPFASSLAQELFESGLIPADTDFRIFRDFGKLSGVDLAWNANGYVYHTALDTADRVPRESLQRTGDNVLALTRGLLASDRLESSSEAEAGARQPVFFDVVGLLVVVARPPAAALAALLTLALVALRLHRAATDARRHLYISRRAWWRQVAGAAAGTAAALLAGLACSAAPALLLHLAGSRLVYYSDNLLLAPLFALPGVCGAWSAARAWSRRGGGGGGGAGALVRGWWAARAWADAGAALWAGALALCLARGVRSGFLALLWALLPSLADLAASASAGVGLTTLRGAGAGGARAWWWAAGALVPALQTWYLALGWLRMFVPLLGRAGTGAPPDLAAAAVVCCLTLAATCWLLPLVVAARSVRRLVYAGVVVSLATLVLVQSTALGAPYSEARPQRFMVFHVRRTVHPLPSGERGDVTSELLYWLPELDANTPHSVDMYVPGMSEASATSAEMCARHPYCGAPYFLPVQGLVARGHDLRAGPGAGDEAGPRAGPGAGDEAGPRAGPGAGDEAGPRAGPGAGDEAGPRARLHARLATRALNATVQVLTADLTGPSHIVLIVGVAAGARVSWCGALEGAPRESRRRWEGRRTYFFTLHDARGEAPKHWNFDMHIEHSFSAAPAQWAWVSAAAHAQAAGAHEQAPEHAALRRAFPPWSHVSGWGVDLHLYDI